MVTAYGNRRRFAWLLVLGALFACGIAASFAFAGAGDVTCSAQTAIADTPARVIDVDGEPITTLPGAHNEAVASACVTEPAASTETIHETTTETVTVTIATTVSPPVNLSPPIITPAAPGPWLYCSAEGTPCVVGDLGRDAVDLRLCNADSSTCSPTLYVSAAAGTVKCQADYFGYEATPIFPGVRHCEKRTP